MNWAKLQKTGGPAKKAVLIVLADHCAGGTTCFPSIALIAETVETSERYVREILQDLVTLGLIEIKHRYRNGKRTSSLYALAVPDDFDAKTYRNQGSGSGSGDYRNQGSTTTGTMVPDLPEPGLRAEPTVEAPDESPELQSSTSSPTLVGPPTAGAAAATQHGASAAELDDPEPFDSHARPVGMQRRAECNRYIELVHRLDDDAVEDALLAFHGDRPKMWRWAYNKAAGAHGVPQRPPGTDLEYVGSKSSAHARLVYEKALRMSSTNPDWEPALINPLETFKNSDRSPSWAA